MGDYISITDVIRFLQIDITSTSKPNEASVEDIIGRMEDLFDKKTNNSWRTKIINEEYANFLNNNSYSLLHRNIKTFNSLEGDKLEVWTGNEWEDYLQTKEEGKNKDFWVNYNAGIIFLKRNYFFGNQYYDKNSNVKVTYRYGKDVVPGDVKEEIILMVAIDIITMYPGNVFYTEGTNTVNMNQEQRVNLWKEKIEEIIRNRGEIVVL